MLSKFYVAAMLTLIMTSCQKTGTSSVSGKSSNTKESKSQSEQSGPNEQDTRESSNGPSQDNEPSGGQIADCDDLSNQCRRLNIYTRNNAFETDCRDESEAAIEETKKSYLELISELNDMIQGKRTIPVPIQSLYDYMITKCEVDATKSEGKPYRLSHVWYRQDGNICGDCGSPESREKNSGHCKQDPSHENFGVDYFGFGIVCALKK